MPDVPITATADLPTAPQAIPPVNPQNKPPVPPGPQDADSQGRLIKPAAAAKPFDHELPTTGGKYYLVAIHESEIGRLKRGVPEKITGWLLNINYVEVATLA